MSGFSNFFTRLLNLFTSSTTRVRVMPDATQEQEQEQEQAQAPRNYMFTDNNSPENIPSFSFVARGLRLPGEDYIQDVHNTGPPYETPPGVRNLISQNRNSRFMFYYNPETLSSAVRDYVREGSAGGGSAGGGSAGGDTGRWPMYSLTYAKKLYAKQAFDASNKARALIRGFENDSKGSVDNVQKCEFECPICYEIIDSNTAEGIILVCKSGHVFHNMCPEYNQKAATEICPICRSLNLFKFDPKQGGGFKSMIKHIKKQKQSRKPKNRSVNQTRKRRKH